MAKEIERKFLLAKGSSIPIPENYINVKIKQGYILLEKDKQLRVRLYVNKGFMKCFLCLKYTGKQIRDEYEYLVPEKDGKEIYSKCNLTVEKKRLSFNSHHMSEVHYDVDTFPNGMQWIEVEFKSIKDMKKWEKNIPSWIGKEITSVSKYSNITLAKQNLKW